jgi:D-sedoheptulose 7-phosphate isomerase
MDYIPAINDYLKKETKVIASLDKDAIDAAMNALTRKYHDDANIYIFGNGGSAATASHFVCDFNKGISDGKNNRFRLICLNDNIPSIMAIANDISFDDVFSYQLHGILNKNDLIIAISGSGNSKNVIKAVLYAKEIGCEVIGLTGYSGGKLRELSNYSLHVNIDDMQITEDVHMIFDHMIMKILSTALD